MFFFNIRYCLPEGTYIISLNDTLLFDEHRKNAEIVVTSMSTRQNVTVSGTTETTFEVVPESSDDDSDDSSDMLLAIFVSVGVIAVIVVIVAYLW